MAALRTLPRWAGQAVSKTVAGMVLGLLTACVLAWLSHGPFPGLQAYGEDLGLRLAVYLDRVGASASGIASRKGDADRHGYIFLDVDPEEGARLDPAAPASACEAYAEALRSGSAGTAPALNCSSARPLNRHLLAAIVAGLRERGARLVVLDVVLAEEPGVVDAAEDAALREVLGAGTDADAPVLFAAPFEVVSVQGDATGEPTVALALRPLVDTDVARGVHAAAALPAPGQPLRRYPKCLARQDGPAGPVPSLPYLAATLLRADVDATRACDAGGPRQTDARHAPGNVPRIVYTLPSMATHEDEGPAPSRAAWAPVRDVYQRCLARHFWDPARSHCGQARAFAGKVVVVGASSALRRDRHYTPLGDMAGPEVVINAVRSFVAYPQLRDRGLGEVLADELGLVLLGGTVWLGYFLFRGWLAEAGRGATPSLPRSIGRVLVVAIAFIVTLVAAAALALVASYRTAGPLPSLDVLVPVLAIAIDEYVELASRLVHRVEGWVDTLLGLRTTPH